MDPVEQDWHTYNDCILKTCNTFIEDGIITPNEIGEIWDELDKEVTELSQKAVADVHTEDDRVREESGLTYDFEEAKKTWKKYRDASQDRSGRASSKNIITRGISRLRNCRKISAR